MRCSTRSKQESPQRSTWSIRDGRRRDASPKAPVSEPLVYAVALAYGADPARAFIEDGVYHRSIFRSAGGVEPYNSKSCRVGIGGQLRRIRIASRTVSARRGRSNGTAQV